MLTAQQIMNRVLKDENGDALQGVASLQQALNAIFDSANNALRIGLAGNMKWVGPGQSIQDAIDSCTSPAQDNPYLVLASPGIYKEKIVLVDHVNLMGSGRKATIITGISGGNIGIVPANNCSIENLGVDGVTYEGEGYKCAWCIGTDSSHSDETFFVRNCWFNSKSSFVHTEGSNVRGHIFNCDGETVYDGYVAVGNTRLFVHNCFTEILYHDSFARKIFVVSGNGGQIHAYNCYTRADLADGGAGIRAVEAYAVNADAGLIRLHNCNFDLKTTGDVQHIYAVRARGENKVVELFGGSIDVDIGGSGYKYCARAEYGGTIKLLGTLYDPDLLFNRDPPDHGAILGIDDAAIKEKAIGEYTLRNSGVAEISGYYGAVTATLPDGDRIGQRKTLVMTHSQYTSTVTVLHHETSDPEVGTFDAVDECWILEWTGNEWVTIYATCSFL